MRWFGWFRKKEPHYVGVSVREVLSGVLPYQEDQNLYLSRLPRLYTCTTTEIQETIRLPKKVPPENNLEVPRRMLS